MFTGFLLRLFAICFAIIGVIAGLLSLLALVVLLWAQGLSIGALGLALLCFSCIGLAIMLSLKAQQRDGPRLPGSESQSFKRWWPWSGSISRQKYPYATRGLVSARNIDSIASQQNLYARSSESTGRELE